jgi:hypothetical protein
MHIIHHLVLSNIIFWKLDVFISSGIKWEEKKGSDLDGPLRMS